MRVVYEKTIFPDLQNLCKLHLLKVPILFFKIEVSFVFRASSLKKSKFEISTKLWLFAVKLILSYEQKC